MGGEGGRGAVREERVGVGGEGSEALLEGGRHPWKEGGTYRGSGALMEGGRHL